MTDVNLNNKTNLDVVAACKHPQSNYLQFSQAFYQNLLAHKRFVVLEILTKTVIVKPLTWLLKCLPIGLFCHLPIVCQ